MTTDEEKRFIEYWEQNRNSKKRLLWQIAAGLPLGVLMVGAILINVYSDWFKGASTYLKLDSERFLVVIIAIFLIVIFIIVFSARHKWEMNEQRYQELKAKKKKE